MNKELHLSKRDFDVRWFSGTGKGGQHRNKHANCCQITHRDSGVSAQCTRHKERTANQREAFGVLVSRLLAHFDAPAKARQDSSLLVRTLRPDEGIATDGDHKQSAQATLDGDIDAFLKRALMGKRREQYTGR